MELRLQTVGIIDGVVAETMVKMTMGAEQVDRAEALGLDIVEDGEALLREVGAAINDDAVVGVIAHHVGILLEAVEFEGFEGHCFDIEVATEPQHTGLEGDGAATCGAGGRRRRNMRGWRKAEAQHAGLDGKVDAVFLFEPVVGEPVGEGLHLYNLAEGCCLGIQMAAF